MMFIKLVCLELFAAVVTVDGSLLAVFVQMSFLMPPLENDPTFFRTIDRGVFAFRDMTLKETVDI